ncbi:uncharacterized protein [Salminus brasiliensis]|uniref:uncharacterized protein n=1 Tax=Salminus brasiliensis TaxID=930266 RepID=UPI003B83970F
MDEAEKYQQRLQAIAEKRRAQEEEDRVRRETEEEWLKLAQRKRKSLRDQWLMEPMPSSAEASGTGTAPWPPTSKTEESAKDTQKEIKEEGDKTTNMSDEQPSQISEMTENEPSSLSENTENASQANPREEEEEEEVLNPEVLLQNGQLERSVLGVLEIKVERDLKTGATTIKSMAPKPAAALEGTGEAVFDDGRRTVHAVGGVEDNQHSEKDLSQILNAISEVGMQTILGSVAITCNEELGGEKERKAETGDPEVKQTSELTHDALQQDDTSDSLAVCKTEAEEPGVNERRDGVDREEKLDGEAKVQEEDWEMVNCRPEEGLDPVVLSFLGFTQVQAGSGLGFAAEGAVLKVEDVLIAGEEDVEMGLSGELGPVTVENQSEREESPKCEESAASSASCPEEIPPEGTLQAVPFAGTGAGTGISVALQEMNNVSDIMDSKESTEDSTEAQQSLPCISSDTREVIKEDIKDVLEDSAEAEEQGAHIARTVVEVKAAEEMEIKHGSNLEDEVFEDIPLDGNKETSQTVRQRATVAQSIEEEPEIQALVSPSVAPNRAGGEAAKRKTCQCCTVM